MALAKKTGTRGARGAVTGGADGPGGKRSRTNGAGRAATSKPATPKPATPKPATSKPATSKPATSKPALSKPALSKLDAERSAAGELDSEALVARFRKTGHEELREILVARHRSLVTEVARALKFRLPKSVDEEDLCNAGFSGFLRAIETFDASKGRGFASYLRQRVHGSMLDELRAMDWLPRLMRSRLAERDRVASEIGQELGREASDEEIAARLGLDLAAYRRSYPHDLPTLSSGILGGVEADSDRIDGKVVGFGLQGRQAGDEQHPLTPLYQRELIERIRDLLSDTEWSLVELHYFEGLKLRVVADRLDLSPARICQIHGAVLQRLKERLREEAPTI